MRRRAGKLLRGIFAVHFIIDHQPIIFAQLRVGDKSAALIIETIGQKPSFPLGIPTGLDFDNARHISGKKDFASNDDASSTSRKPSPTR